MCGVLPVRPVFAAAPGENGLEFIPVAPIEPRACPRRADDRGHLLRRALWGSRGAGRRLPTDIVYTVATLVNRRRAS
jgi:hypothetical protein